MAKLYNMHYRTEKPTAQISTSFDLSKWIEHHSEYPVNVNNSPYYELIRPNPYQHEFDAALAELRASEGYYAS